MFRPIEGVRLYSLPLTDPRDGYGPIGLERRSTRSELVSIDDAFRGPSKNPGQKIGVG